MSSRDFEDSLCARDDEIARLKRANEMLRNELHAARSTERDLGTGPVKNVEVRGSIAVAEYADRKIRISKVHTPAEFIVIEPADQEDLRQVLHDVHLGML